MGLTTICFHFKSYLPKNTYQVPLWSSQVPFLSVLSALQVGLNDLLVSVWAKWPSSQAKCPSFQLKGPSATWDSLNYLLFSPVALVISLIAHSCCQPKCPSARSKCQTSSQSKCSRVFQVSQNDLLVDSTAPLFSSDVCMVSQSVLLLDPNAPSKVSFWSVQMQNL